MYTIVVCSNCQYVWFVEDRPEQSQCGKCRKTRKFDKLKKLDSVETKEKARSRLPAWRAKINGTEEMFQQAVDNGVFDVDTDEIMAEDDEYLEEMGVDPDEVSDAKDRVMKSKSSRSQQEVLHDAIREQSSPTKEDIVQYAEDNGVGREKVEEFLEKKRREGEILVNGGVYKLV